jgi:NitT/TauT family transport system substrate-binding protein
MLAANRDYVRRNPVATKSVIRAILKVADFYAAEPAQAARRLVDHGFTDHYELAVQGLQEVL